MRHKNLLLVVIFHLLLTSFIVGMEKPLGEEQLLGQLDHIILQNVAGENATTVKKILFNPPQAQHWRLLMQDIDKRREDEFQRIVLEIQEKLVGFAQMILNANFQENGAAQNNLFNFFNEALQSDQTRQENGAPQGLSLRVKTVLNETMIRFTCWYYWGC